MTLYEIDNQIAALIDAETGEITDFDAFEGLTIARDQKLENIALYVKNLKAEAEALKTEEANLAKRRKTAENKAENLKQYLDTALQGNPFKTARVVCSYRKTQSVECDESFIEWARNNAYDLLTYKEPTVNKTAIKEAIKEGRSVEHATLKDGMSFSIK